MPADPPEKIHGPGDERRKWLLQFYHDGKSTGQSDDDCGLSLPDFAVAPSEKYRIGDELGAGGMKSVLRTLDLNTERYIAMAVPRDASVKLKKMAYFVREARITAALEHPNIVPIYDIGLDSAGKPYFTMKLLGGETLQSILQRVHADCGDCRARHPLNSLLHVFQGICNAIAFAHSRGVIHLDIKPANIQVGDFGEVLVLDWGLAKVLDKDHPILHRNRLVLDEGLREILSAGAVSGTPGFMSPEQARGENASLDERTDIFALGAILNAILNCRTSPGEKTGRLPRQENTSIPAALEAVAAKAMSGDPADRYQTVEELAGEVRAYVEGFATKAQQAGILMLLWLLIKRHHVVATLSAISLVTVFSIFTVAFVKIRRSELIAVDSLKKIQTEQQRAYDAQQREHQDALIAAPQVMGEARNYMRLLDFDSAIASIEHAVSLDKNFSEGWLNLSAIYLGRQEFDKASQAFSHLRKPDPSPPGSPPVDLQGVLEKYMAILHAKGPEGIRKAQMDFVYDIIHAGHDSFAYRGLALAQYFKKHNRNPKEVDFDTVEKSLKWLNLEAEDITFTHEYIPMGLKITLHGSKVEQILPLTGLPISVLDASHTGNMDLTWLHDAPLISLDLSDSATRETHPLNEIATLEELRLNVWGNKDYNWLRSLPQIKRVIVNDTDVSEARQAVNGVQPPPLIIGRSSANSAP